ncbi:MAG: hypothetical protein K2H19_07100 [Ruminococcus sp.]|nr:hypothetical protein [Ruminococcus sp.]
MRIAEKITAVLCCLICLSACRDKKVSDFSENIIMTELMTTETTTTVSISSTMTSAEITTTETIPETTEIEAVDEVSLYFDEENEVPENAVYKEIVLNYSKYHDFKVRRDVTFYDIHDNPIFELYQVTSEQTVPSRFEHFYEYNSDGTKSSEEYDEMHGRRRFKYEYYNGLLIRETAFMNGNIEYTESYEYDEHDNPIKSVHESHDNESVQTVTYYTYEYDDNGRFISRITKNTADYQSNEQFTYGENGKVENHIRNEMRINYTYDSDDQLTVIQLYTEDGLLWYELYEYEFYN